MTHIRIDVDEVRTAAGRLDALPEPLSTVSSGLTGGDGLMTSDAATGFENFSLAWSAALDLLGDDATYVATKARQAADAYARTSGHLGGAERR